MKKIRFSSKEEMKSKFKKIFLPNLREVGDTFYDLDRFIESKRTENRLKRKLRGRNKQEGKHYGSIE